MEGQRCPYHVKQGFVNELGQLAVHDVCGVKTAGELFASMLHSHRFHIGTVNVICVSKVVENDKFSCPRTIWSICPKLGATLRSASWSLCDFSKFWALPGRLVICVLGGVSPRSVSGI